MYRAPKAAVNLPTIQYAKANPGIRVVALDPDMTATDTTGGQGQEPALAANTVSQAVTAGPHAPTSVLHSEGGVTVPW